jgi:diguanylate cyclase (GGDEF)-like protein
MEALSIVLIALLAAAVAGMSLLWRRVQRFERLAAFEFAERRRLDAETAAARGEHERLVQELAARDEQLRQQREELAKQTDRLQQELAKQADRLQQDLANQAERHEQELANQAERHEQALAEERERRSRAERAREIEHGWNEDLRVKLAELTAARHPLGDTSDVRLLVLRAAIRLLGAEKGLLLSRQDEDSDGDLDLICAEGFEHDAEESALAQHFARQVLAKDETVRASNTGDLDLTGETPADDEIDNLVAIPIYIRDRFSGVVVCANKPGGFTEYDDDVLLALGNQAGVVLQNARLRGDVRVSYLGIVRMLAEVIEAKDRTLHGHVSDISEHVARVAERIGLPPQQREQVVFAALLHDIGKLGISERILLKPGPLTAEERAIVELHPRIGARLIEHVPALRAIVPALLYHHERWDGEGYPSGLRGKDIPVEARLVAIADAFSAMTQERPYREKMSTDEACDELRRCAGSQFDAAITRLFVEELRRHPLDGDVPDALTAAFADSELATRRAQDEPLLGFGAFSVVDNLTLLYSHRYLHELAAAEARRADLQNRPFAVVQVELTDLVDVNRNEGYDAGDAAIRSVADVVQRVAGRSGGTAARESGRRISLLVPGADDEIAEQLADEISAALEDHNVQVRVAAWREGDSGEAVLERARGRAVAQPRRQRSPARPPRSAR